MKESLETQRTLGPGPVAVAPEANLTPEISWPSGIRPVPYFRVGRSLGACVILAVPVALLASSRSTNRSLHARTARTSLSPSGPSFDAPSGGVFSACVGCENVEAGPVPRCLPQSFWPSRRGPRARLRFEVEPLDVEGQAEQPQLSELRNPIAKGRRGRTLYPSQARRRSCSSRTSFPRSSQEDAREREREIFGRAGEEGGASLVHLLTAAHELGRCGGFILCRPAGSAGNTGHRGLRHRAAARQRHGNKTPLPGQTLALYWLPTSAASSCQGFL